MQIYNINTKSISRIVALQIIYQYLFYKDLYNIDNSVINEEYIDKIIFDLSYYYSNYEYYGIIVDIEKKDIKYNIKLNINYIKKLVNYTIKHLQEVDDIINQFANKGVSGIILHNILRLGIIELKYCDIPPKVIVSQYTDIASSFIDEQQVHFVNFILDSISKSSTL